MEETDCKKMQTSSTKYGRKQGGKTVAVKLTGRRKEVLATVVSNIALQAEDDI